MRIYRIASTDSDVKDLKDSIRDLKKELKDFGNDVKPMKKDWKDFERRIKKIEKELEALNIGNRQFYQQYSIFTSLQRKIEKFDLVEQEWKKYKEKMDDKIRKEVEHKFRAQIT